MAIPDEGPEPQAGDEILFGGKTKGWYRWAAWFAGICYASRMLPRHVETKEQALYILLKGEELGLKPTFAWDYLYPTKSGKLGIPKRAALAVVQASPMFGGYEERIEGEGENMRGVAIATRKGFPPTLKEFTMKDAAAAGLTKMPRTRDGGTYEGPWQAYLKDMLLARAAGRALNVAFAAELSGCLVEGEAEDAAEMEERRQGKKAAALPAAPPARDPLLKAIVAQKALPAPAADEVVLDPALVRVISDQVDQMFPADSLKQPIEEARDSLRSGPPPAAQPEPAKAAKPEGSRRARPTVSGSGTGGGSFSGGMHGATCDRCRGAINAMGGCDICGWPGPDIR